MSKRCQKQTKTSSSNGDGNFNTNSSKISENPSLKVDIGVSNVKRWKEVKSAFSCTSDEEFTAILLDLAQKQTKRKAATNVTENVYPKSETVHKPDKLQNEIIPTTLCQTNSSLEKASNSKVETCFEDNVKEEINVSDVKMKVELVEELSVQKEIPVPLDTLLKTSVKNCIAKSKQTQKLGSKLKQLRSRRKARILPEVQLFQKTEKQLLDNNTKKKADHDVRKAPELKVQATQDSNISDDLILEKQEQESCVSEKQKLAIKIKMCFNCGTRHVQELCPLQNIIDIVLDAINLEKWGQDYKTGYRNVMESNEEINNYTYAHASLPSVLLLDDSNTSHGLSVFAKCEIKEFTQFGPLVGKLVKEVDVPEDFTMHDLWEVYSENGNIYINTENFEDSNWIRFIRPATVREDRNVTAVSRENYLYFITTKSVSSGEELLYWQDDTFKTNKKKMEKTTCGGCNMTFSHPLYYRTHCSIFHDIRYSLTIRKYHCKVCGAAVLGKENIMKHAAELHNGQGAYQCQFCKKFFLRLNYLEMHRTYGCSANPHRSRPLCDFCGRKFCQPQKLKVHIKRMHSDMAEVLKEFQCKNCLKILGSRAALQRHLKEVHQKQVEGACSCSRCGKLFQNKSNLKIHMLTHSGIKPFKCGEKSCMAAFTTKQCLQFHYKKVHAFTEDMMPKIERSVEYTFEAYSGDQENMEISPDGKISSQQNKLIENYLDDSSDIDDDSLDPKSLDDPPPLCSPALTNNEHSSGSNASAPTLEAHTNHVKILSKGSKKWIGDPPLQNDLYQLETRAQKLQEMSLDVEETTSYEPSSTNLTTFNRRESSNASLLVEAALDSVCSEPNIDIDVSTTSNCTDPLNNLYTLSHSDNLPEVNYSHSIDMNETRDINLISPSVNDHISVTDDLNEDLRHSQNIGIDYSTFQHEDFSSEGSPNMQDRNNFGDYMNANPISPQDNYEPQSKNESPVRTPPRYDFGHAVTTDHLSSDDSNGIGAQNLSLHNSTKDNIQLDLSIYKSPYNLDSSFQLRKDFRIKFDMDAERSKESYILNVEDVSKNYDEPKFIEGETQMDNDELIEKDFQDISGGEIKDKNSDLEGARNLVDIRSKFEIDLDLRTKNYELENELRNRSYDNNLDEFRIKNYDLVESLETRNSLDVRNKMYDGLLENEFRADRNYEPLVINSDLQGLDMTARSYHNYSNLNRYHHLYADVERPSVDLRLNYSPPPPSYTHADILRVVSIDLTPPGRHSVDLSLRSQLATSRLLSDHPANPHRLALDQTRLLTADLSTTRHISTDSRMISDLGNRILSDHTTNRLLSNDQLTTNRLLTNDPRIIGDETRLLSDQGRLLGESRILQPAAPSGSSLSPVPFAGYSISPTPYHPTALPPRPHASSPTPSPYHHYSAYY